MVALASFVALQIGAGIVVADELKVGDVAPDFSLPGSDGRTHALAEHHGKRVVVVAWFPKAFTGG
jgi:peroxiredoxin Q/BCP